MEQLPADHTREDHEISGSPWERMQKVIARHLCGWITGHSVLVDQFLSDAHLIMQDAHEAGVRFHLVSEATNPSDGFVDVVVREG